MKPGDIMATGIEESLAERGLTMAILELIDEGLRGTRQTKLTAFGLNIAPNQTTLFSFSKTDRLN
tara:strand:+ start:1942 stop:2136 length:195 start_codon:yes stop_codon:yes gene_type:complete